MVGDVVVNALVVVVWPTYAPARLTPVADTDVALPALCRAAADTSTLPLDSTSKICHKDRVLIDIGIDCTGSRRRVACLVIRLLLWECFGFGLLLAFLLFRTTQYGVLSADCVSYSNVGTKRTK